jgi:crotonobetainyl-CoA:carnitine CoA-transferase CaiB-like acyl-CoA transferase
MLNRCRALDLTDETGFLAGKILADLGVDVVKVERPGGDASRNQGPFWHDVPDPEESLYWFSYNTNKRGVTLDLEKTEGQELFRRLVRVADFLIESFAPGFLDRLGLGYSALKELNPGLIFVSITPFGQTGPYRDFHACDLVVMGLAGMMYLTGDADRPPLNISLPQSHLLGGADGAVGALIAFHHRKRTGRGQHVDVSLQQSSAWFLANTVPYWELEGTNLTRVGALRSMNARQTRQRQVWPCKDGYVFFFLLGGVAGAKPFRKLVEWMEDEGAGDAFLRDLEWEKVDMGTVTQDVLDRVAGPVGAFFLTRTREEIMDAAIARGISLCPLSSMEAVLHDGHLRERNFWRAIPHPELGCDLPYPRQFAEMSELTPTTRTRAPLIGEHNDAVYREAGLSGGDLLALKLQGAI